MPLKDRPRVLAARTDDRILNERGKHGLNRSVAISFAMGRLKYSIRSVAGPLG